MHVTYGIMVGPNQLGLAAVLCHTVNPTQLASANKIYKICASVWQAYLSGAGAPEAAALCDQPEELSSVQKHAALHEQRQHGAAPPPEGAQLVEQLRLVLCGEQRQRAQRVHRHQHIRGDAQRARQLLLGQEARRSAQHAQHGCRGDGRDRGC